MDDDTSSCDDGLISTALELRAVDTPSLSPSVEPVATASVGLYRFSSALTSGLGQGGHVCFTMRQRRHPRHHPEQDGILGLV